MIFYFKTNAKVLRFCLFVQVSVMSKILSLLQVWAPCPCEENISTGSSSSSSSFAKRTFEKLILFVEQKAFSKATHMLV